MVSIYQFVSCPCALSTVGRKEKGKKVLMEIYRPERCENETPVAFHTTPVSIRWQRNQLVWQTRGRKELFGVFYQLIKYCVRLIRHDEVNAKEMDPSRNSRTHTDGNKQMPRKDRFKRGLVCLLIRLLCTDCECDVHNWMEHHSQSICLMNISGERCDTDWQPAQCWQLRPSAVGWYSRFP